MRAWNGLVAGFLLIHGCGAAQAVTFGDMQDALQNQQCPTRRVADTSPEQVCPGSVNMVLQMPDCQNEYVNRQRLIDAYNRKCDMCAARRRAKALDAGRVPAALAGPRAANVVKRLPAKATAPVVTRTTSRSKAASTSTGVAADSGTTTKSSVTSTIAAQSAATSPAHAPTRSGVSALKSRKMSRCTDQQLDWSKLSSTDQQLWSRLGWTQARWDSDKAPPSESKSWSDLTKTEKKAASQLGFDERNWDVECQLTPQKVEPEFDQDDN